MRVVTRAIAVAFVGLCVGCSDADLGGDTDTSPLHYRSAGALAESIRRGEILPSELLERQLARVAERNPALNAIVAFDLDAARTRAAEADRALERGEIWGPLHGLPITIKDSFGVVGMPTTGGVPEFAEFVSDDNAVAVQRLIDAGAIVFGKTNLPFLASDWQSYNAIYGTTNNPWDLTRTPGGSSGGSAAAVAAGLTTFELGSDIAGSIRIPAHYTGTYGHKPTFGLVPRAGQFPMFDRSDLPPDTMSVAGPMTRTADDLDLLLSVLIADGDEQGRAVALPGPRAERLEDYRVAAWLDDPRLPVDAAVDEPLRDAVAKLREAGVRVDEMARPDTTLARAYEVHFGLLVSIINSFPTPPDAYEEKERHELSWDRFFEDYDIVLAPTAQTVAPQHDQSEPLGFRLLEVNGAPWTYGDQGVWIAPATLAGLPATTAPVGRSSSGLPVGIQIIGPRFGDRSTIDFARRMAEVLGGFVPPPDP